MNLFAAPKLPFETVEEAIDYIQENGEKKFLDLMLNYRNDLLSRQTILLFLLFPVYLALASLILLFDYDKINQATAKVLEFFYIPVDNPNGWNLSMVLAFLTNIGLLIYLSRQYNFSVFRQLTRVKFSFKYIFLLFFVFCFFVLGLFMGYIFTLTKQTDSCTLRTLCGLYTDNMFVHSSVALYTVFCIVGMTTCVMVYSRFYEKFCKVKIGD